LKPLYLLTQFSLYRFLNGKIALIAVFLRVESRCIAIPRYVQKARLRLSLSAVLGLGSCADAEVSLLSQADGGPEDLQLVRPTRFAREQSLDNMPRDKKRAIDTYKEKVVNDW
jgi:hypothetical protein